MASTSVPPGRSSALFDGASHDLGGEDGQRGRPTLNLGYSLASEEHSPSDLVVHARMAEEAGFTFAFISDHFHPWTTHQGNSPFVWSVIGGIAEATERIVVGTGVTCPTFRTHPAIVAHAAATAADMLPGRFVLGLGTGEALNEHITGEYWPAGEERIARLAEAIDIIRELWTGDVVDFCGDYYTVEDARLFTLPDELPPIVVAAAHRATIELAAANDGIVTTSPDPDLVARFEDAGGADKPRFAQLTVSWARDDEEARRQAFEWWPTAALGPSLHTEVASPRLYDDIVSLLDQDQVAAALPCGSSAGFIVEALEEYREAGIDNVYIHQVGPNQAEFIDFFKREVTPEVLIGA
jgi:G6PDH family F420-dependent oxidoreductase